MKRQEKFHTEKTPLSSANVVDLSPFPGWAATLKFNSDVRAQFDSFYHRSDTFSLGVCNGCQLMALLGWVAPDSANSTNGNTKGRVILI